jgi:hypothetical protein
MRMIDCQPTMEDRMGGPEFVALAEQVLDRLGGEPNRFGGRTYEDDWVRLDSNHNGLDFQVTRKAQDIVGDHPESHLRVSNPTTMVRDGEMIRHHGEYMYLVAHLRRLAA